MELQVRTTAAGPAITSNPKYGLEAGSALLFPEETPSTQQLAHFPFCCFTKHPGRGVTPERPVVPAPGCWHRCGLQDAGPFGPIPHGHGLGGLFSWLLASPSYVLSACEEI